MCKTIYQKQNGRVSLHQQYISIGVTEHLSTTYKIGKIYPLAKTNTVKGPTINLKGGGVMVFVSFRNFFSDNTRVRIFIFLSRKVQIFFSEYFFRKKNP